MWIYLLRHGVAEELGSGMTDADRPLTEQGRQKLRAARETWRRLLRDPSLVVTSPLLRARQTAEVFLEATDAAEVLRVDESLVPGAQPRDAVTMLEGLMLAGTESVALVGHEPHLGCLLGELITGQPRRPVPLKKGMLVGLQTEATTSLVCSLRFCLSQKDAAKLA